MGSFGLMTFFSVLSVLIQGLITITFGVLLMKHLDVIKYVKGILNENSDDLSDNDLMDNRDIIDAYSVSSSPALLEMLSEAFKLFSTAPAEELSQNGKYQNISRIIVLLGKLIVISGFLVILISLFSMFYVNTRFDWY